MIAINDCELDTKTNNVAAVMVLLCYWRAQRRGGRGRGRVVMGLGAFNQFIHSGETATVMSCTVRYMYSSCSGKCAYCDVTSMAVAGTTYCTLFVISCTSKLNALQCSFDAQ